MRGSRQKVRHVAVATSGRSCAQGRDGCHGSGDTCGTLRASWPGRTRRQAGVGPCRGLRPGSSCRGHPGSIRLLGLPQERPPSAAECTAACCFVPQKWTTPQAGRSALEPLNSLPVDRLPRGELRAHCRCLSPGLPSPRLRSEDPTAPSCPGNTAGHTSSPSQSGTRCPSRGGPWPPLAVMERGQRGDRGPRGHRTRTAAETRTVLVGRALGAPPRQRSAVTKPVSLSLTLRTAGLTAGAGARRGC